jgi:hypothetical protein
MNGLIKQSRSLTPLVVLVVLHITLLASAQVKNPGFEDKQNKDWKRDGPKVPRKAPREKSVIRKETNGNSYGHLGDRNDRGRDAENPTRFFQHFICDFDTIGDCQVHFRYRTNILQGEMAWVRLKGNQTKVFQIPHSNGQWRGPVNVYVPGCTVVYVEFGLLRVGGGKIASSMGIDDVSGFCSRDATTGLFPFPTDVQDSLPTEIPQWELEQSEDLPCLASQQKGMDYYLYGAVVILILLTLWILIRRRGRS